MLVCIKIKIVRTAITHGHTCNGRSCCRQMRRAGTRPGRIESAAYVYAGGGLRSRIRLISNEHQIRMHADKLLGPEVSDVDGNTEERRGTVSVFNGPLPDIRILETPEDEIKAVAQWLKDLLKEGIKPHEIGVFVRSGTELARAHKAVEQAGLVYKVLDEHVETTSGYASIGSMHLAKGLEFRAVAVMACDDEVIPLQERIETVVDDSDLEEVYNTERHLLYVACTRARDQLLITSGDKPSEFLDDLVLTNEGFAS